MLLSQKDQSRLCIKAMPERKTRPIDTYDEDRLREMMIALDGPNGKAPPSWGHETPPEENNNTGRPGRNQDKVLAALEEHGELTLPEIVELVGVERDSLSVSMYRMLSAKKLERRTNSAAGNLWAIAGAPAKREQEMLDEILRHMKPGKEYTSRDIGAATRLSSNVIARRMSNMNKQGILTCRMYKKRYRWKLTAKGEQHGKFA